MTLLFPKPVRVERKRKPLRSRRHRETRVNKLGHEFLYGVQAHIERRIQLFERAGGRVYVERDAEGKVESVCTAFPAHCEMCAETHELTWELCDWIHLEKRHCDCLECSALGCRAGHIRLHHGRNF